MVCTCDFRWMMVNRLWMSFSSSGIGSFRNDNETACLSVCVLVLLVSCSVVD